jgi:hypothetical protein
VRLHKVKCLLMKQAATIFDCLDIRLWDYPHTVLWRDTNILDTQCSLNCVNCVQIRLPGCKEGGHFGPQEAWSVPVGNGETAHFFVQPYICLKNWEHSTIRHLGIEAVPFSEIITRFHGNLMAEAAGCYEILVNTYNTIHCYNPEYVNPSI